MKNVLLFFSIKYNGNWDKIYKALETKEDIDENIVEEFSKKYKGKFLTILDDKYPLSLKKINRPPFVLFYKGNIDILNREQIIWPFASYVSKNFIEICKLLNETNSYFVTGIFNIIEKEIIKNNHISNLIIVKDNGIDANEKFSKKHLILSEYPCLIKSSIENWIESNKIKHGISKGLFLINSEKSKDFFEIIANAIENGNEIFCLKSKKNDINNHNNILISKGAKKIEVIKELENG